MANKTAIMDQYDEKRTVYENFASEVKHLLERLLYDDHIQYNAITFRLKERDSLSKKIDIKGDKYTDLTEITDVAGIRVITYYADDVDRIAQIVEQEFMVDKENSIDKRKALEPDRFGYCSVHYVVGMHSKRLGLSEYKAYEGLKCEIQIRSVLQHAWAEIEHDLGYKSEVSIPREVRRNFSRLAGLLEIADKEFQEIRQMLTSYKRQIEKKISEEDVSTTEIDAVSLETLADNNQELKEMNDQIAGYFGKTISEHEEAFARWERVIQYLSFFGIHTLGQVLEFIAKNKENAIKIAEEFIEKDTTDPSAKIFNTIGFFYLCYAELLAQSEDQTLIIRYLEQNGIGGDIPHEETAQKLLRIKEKVFK